MEQIQTLLTGALEARGRVLVKLNVEEARLDDVIALLPALRSPTVSKLAGSGAYAVETVVAKSRDQHAHPRAQGARRHRHHRAADRQDRPLIAHRARAGRHASTSAAGSGEIDATTATRSRSTAPRSPTAAAGSPVGAQVEFDVVAGRPGSLGGDRRSHSRPERPRRVARCTGGAAAAGPVLDRDRLQAAVHQRDVGECLREVARAEPLGHGVVLLGEQARRRWTARSAARTAPGLVDAPHQREVVGQPERARQEHALARRKPVDGRLSVE